MHHQGTSRIYTYFGLITADKQITMDVNTLFLEITGLGQPIHRKSVSKSVYAAQNDYRQHRARAGACQGRQARALSPNEFADRAQRD